MNAEINSLNLWDLGCRNCSIPRDPTVTSQFPNNPENPVLCRQQYAQAQGLMTSILSGGNSLSRSHFRSKGDYVVSSVLWEWKEVISVGFLEIPFPLKKRDVWGENILGPVSSFPLGMCGWKDLCGTTADLNYQERHRKDGVASRIGSWNFAPLDSLLGHLIQLSPLHINDFPSESTFVKSNFFINSTKLA